MQPVRNHRAYQPADDDNDVPDIEQHYSLPCRDIPFLLDFDWEGRVGNDRPARRLGLFK